MNDIVKKVMAERQAEREALLGPDALSVSSTLLKKYAPKGWSILHIQGQGKPRIDERGMVHFSPPIDAVVQEETMFGPHRPKKIIQLDISREQIAQGFNGEFFVPRITEHDSALFAKFLLYMDRVKVDPLWYTRGGPIEEVTLPQMSESESKAWDRWVNDEKRRATEIPHHLKIQK